MLCFFQDRYTSFNVILLAKISLSEFTPLCPMLHKVKDWSLAFALRPSPISLMYSSIPSSPQIVKLFTEHCLIITQYTPHGDALFLLKSTYSNNNVTLLIDSCKSCIPLIVILFSDKSSSLRELVVLKQLLTVVIPVSDIWQHERSSLATLVVLHRPKVISAMAKSLMLLL